MTIGLQCELAACAGTDAAAVIKGKDHAAPRATVRRLIPEDSGDGLFNVVMFRSKGASNRRQNEPRYASGMDSTDIYRGRIPLLRIRETHGTQNSNYFRLMHRTLFTRRIQMPPEQCDVVLGYSASSSSGAPASEDGSALDSCGTIPRVLRNALKLAQITALNGTDSRAPATPPW